ncbi:MAG: peptidylprolyl isomerase [Candidatus Neomarinimicrobiota bacterium]
MKKLIVLVSVLSLLVVGCSKKEPVVKLKKDTPAYQLAQEISVRLPYLEPGKNNPLITTKNFDISAGEVFQMIQDNFGKRAVQLKTLDVDRVKDIIKQNALVIAEKKLLFNEAKLAKMIATEAEVDSFMNMQMAQFGGKEKFMQGLQENDISMEAVREDVVSSLSINRFLEDTLTEASKVNEDDIKKAYSEDKSASVRHILFLTQGKPDSAKKMIRAKAEEVLKLAKSGGNFEKLVKQYSEDPGSKDNGGLYKDFERGQMVKPFEDAAFLTPIGQISDVVETNFGFHIIKVIDQKKETQPLQKVREKLTASAQVKKQAEAYENFLKKLKETYEFKEVEF